LHRLPDGRRSPLTASSFGTGQLLGAALDAGCHTIVLGIGGSACPDGGGGLVEAPRAPPRDRPRDPPPRGGAAPRRPAAADLTELHPRLGTARIVVATDVDNPLLGPRGAAAVYAPQKGASSAEIVVLEDALQRWAAVVGAITGVDVSDQAGAG